MGDATLYTVLPTHTEDAGVALASVGLFLGANRAIRLLLNGPAGWAYDRWPRRSLFIVSLLIGAVSTALYAATRGFWPLLLARLLWGAAWSGIWVGGSAIILDITTDQNRGRWTGLYQTWFFFGAALGSLGGGISTDQLGYRTTMWIGAAMTLAGALFAWRLLPETRGFGRVKMTYKATGNARLRANTPFWAAVSLQGVNRFVIAGVLSATMALLVQESLQTGWLIGVATMTGLLSAGRTLLGMFAAPLAGTLSDRLGGRWQVAAWGMAAGAAGMALTAWRAPAGILMGVFLGAISTGSVQALAIALAGDVVHPSQRGQAIGLLHTVGDLGSALGPPLAYALLPLIGLRTIYLLCAVLFVIGLIPALAFSRRQALDKG
jgi:MFS family permease